MSTTVTQKGQVTIPKIVRDALGILPGTRVSFNLDGHQAVMKKSDQKKDKMDRWVGFGRERLKGFKNVDDYLAFVRGRKPRS